jgi:hypothetical protein
MLSMKVFNPHEMEVSWKIGRLMEWFGSPHRELALAKARKQPLG